MSKREAASKNYVDKKFNDPSMIKNSTHVGFNDKNLDEVRFIRVNSMPILEEQLSPKLFVDQAISDGVDESSLLRSDPDEKLDLDEQNSIVLYFTLTLPKTIIEKPTKNMLIKNLLNLVYYETVLMLTSMIKFSITSDLLK